MNTPSPQHYKPHSPLSTQLANEPNTQSLRMELVRKGTEPNIAWESVKVLFEDVDGKPCNGSYEAVVDDSWPTSDNGELYALWISGSEYNSDTGYADLTDWFSIEKA